MAMAGLRSVVVVPFLLAILFRTSHGQGLRSELLQFSFALDLSRSASVEATAECASGTEFCDTLGQCSVCNASDPQRSFPASNAVDGNVGTSWHSPPLSAGSQFQDVNFTLQLNRTYVLLSGDIDAGSNSFLPARWSLFRSPNPLAPLVPVATYLPDASQCADLEGGGVACSSTTGESVVAIPIDREFLRFASLHFVFEEPSDPSPASMGLQQRQLFYSLAEIALVVIEPVCLVCLDPLSQQLSQLTSQIEDAIDRLPDPLNATDVEGVALNINDTVAAVEAYEDTVLTLEVVLGTEPPLPGETQLSEEVERLDLQLTPSILEKLDQLDGLVEMTSDFEFDASNAQLLLETVELRVREVLDNATSFSEEVEELLFSLINLTNRLRADVNSTLEAVAMLRVVLSRTYDDIAALVMRVEGEAGERVDVARGLFETTQRQWNETLQVGAEFDRVREIIEAASALALAIEQQLLLAVNQSIIADQNLVRVTELMREGVRLQRAGEMELEAVARLLMATEELLNSTRETTEVLTTLLPSLGPLLTLLSDEVAAFSSALSPLRPPAGCDPASANCTAGEVHATALSEDAEFYVNSSISVYTLRRARNVLNNIDTTGGLFDFNELNAIALAAVNISRQALDTLSRVNTSELRAQSLELQSTAEGLRNSSLLFTTRALTAIARAAEGRERLEELAPTLSELMAAVGEVRNDTAFLRERRATVQAEADQLVAISNSSLNTLAGANTRVASVEAGLPNVTDALRQTTDNIAAAETALNETEGQFPTIERFLNATQAAAGELMLNISAFVSENNRIIAEIDSLIASLDDIHTRINRVNSPVRLASEPAAPSYLSLQPPPGRLLEDSIQFESLDLYLWPSAAYRTPALLFYAGPVYPEDENTTSLADEDYFILTAESMGLAVQWDLGGSSGSVSLPLASINGFSQILVTRVGSQFMLSFGSAVGLLMSAEPGLSTAVQNNSLLFRTSDRTAFLLGGSPRGAQLGSVSSPLPLSRLSPFQGQVQLFLFNGDQWGVWNIRGASRTDFIGNDEFQQSVLASANVWSPASALFSSTLSFTGRRSYLRVEQFADIVNFNGNPRGIELAMRAIDETDGLVLYAYDPELQVSVEIAFMRGNLSLIIKHHSGTTPPLRIDVESTTPSVTATPRTGRILQIFSFQGGEFFVDNSPVGGVGIPFFNDLTRVRAWYGGVREEMLESPFVPEITNASYFGCVEVTVLTTFLSTTTLFMGEFFRDQYIGSLVQNGMAGTCLMTEYTRQVGLDGSEGAFLSYSHAELFYPPNLNPETPPTTPSDVISLDFFPAAPFGVIMAIRGQSENVSVVMREGRVVVASTGGGGITLEAPEGVSMGEWHSLLLEFDTNRVAFYVDGVLQGSIAVGLTFQLPISPSDQPLQQLFIGGAPQGVFPNIDTLPPFTGCLSDFAYNFIPMSFLNAALQLERRYPEGVSYNACPFSNATRFPLLDVGAEQPAGRSCLPGQPEALPNTHGSFHRDTSLTTSNVLGLLQSSWEMSMELKQTGDGHVMTVTSALGHVISLAIVDSRVTLSVNAESANSSVVLEDNIFTSLVLSCAVAGSRLTCSLVVGGQDGSGVEAGAAHAGSTFVPNLPIEFGSINSSGIQSQSFVGCIRGLATNGNTSGFENVRTGVPCYNVTEPGLGFSGISLIAETLPEATGSISVDFKALVDNGLLLLLSATSTSDPIFAVGVFQRQLRVRSNFTATTVEGLPTNFFTVQDPPSVCIQSNSDPFSLSLNISSSAIVLTVGDSRSEFLLGSSLEGRGIFLSVGNTLAEYTPAFGAGEFNFLLSQEVDQDSRPPGFIGCVQRLAVDGAALTLDQADTAEGILNGFCPSV